MTMALSDLARAARDEDLLERMAAAAAEVGVPNPESFARQYAMLVMSQETDGQSLAAAYAYAVAEYKPTPTPGANPGAVTDAMLVAGCKAVMAILNPSPPPAIIEPTAVPVEEVRG